MFAASTRVSQHTSMLQEDTSHLTLVQGCVGRLVVSLLLAAHLGPAEAAKGSLRAGVLSRGGMRRSKSRHYDHGLGWDAHGEDTCATCATCWCGLVTWLVSCCRPLHALPQAGGRGHGVQ